MVLGGWGLMVKCVDLICVCVCVMWSVPADLWGGVVCCLHFRCRPSVT